MNRAMSCYEPLEPACNDIPNVFLPGSLFRQLLECEMNELIKDRKLEVLSRASVSPPSG